MSEIDNMIADLCPNGVTFETISNLTSRVTDGSHNPPRATAGASFPMISAKNIAYGVIDFADARMLSEGDFEIENRRTNVSPGDVLLTIVGAIGRVAVVETESPMVFQRSVCVLKPLDDKILPKFLRYALESRPIQAVIHAQANGAAQRGIYLNQVAALRVPAPPIEIQEKIVSILDAFTALQAELKAELQARTRQYGHYRNQLFTVGYRETVKWALMGDVGAFFRGRRFTKNDMVDDGLDAIHYGEIYTAYGAAADSAISHVREDLAGSLRYAEPGDVVIAGVGETVEDVGKAVAWLGDGRVAIHDDTFGFRHAMNPKFVSYYLQTATFHAQKEKHVSRAKVKRLSSAGLAQISMPVPSRQEQDRIVDILDRFEALLMDISIGLPAEIAARRKQYEYYRDKLLTFEEKVA